MRIPFLIDEVTLNDLAEWMITGMTLVLGARYLKQIVAYVLTELYRVFIQRGAWPI